MIRYGVESCWCICLGDGAPVARPYCNRCGTLMYCENCEGWKTPEHDIEDAIYCDDCVTLCVSLQMAREKVTQ